MTGEDPCLASTRSTSPPLVAEVGLRAARPRQATRSGGDFLSASPRATLHAIPPQTPPGGDEGVTDRARSPPQPPISFGRHGAPTRPAGSHEPGSRLRGGFQKPSPPRPTEQLLARAGRQRCRDCPSFHVKPVRSGAPASQRTAPRSPLLSQHLRCTSRDCEPICLPAAPSGGGSVSPGRRTW